MIGRSVSVCRMVGDVTTYYNPSIRNTSHHMVREWQMTDWRISKITSISQSVIRLPYGSTLQHRQRLNENNSWRTGISDQTRSAHIGMWNCSSQVCFYSKDTEGIKRCSFICRDLDFIEYRRYCEKNESRQTWCSSGKWDFSEYTEEVLQDVQRCHCQTSKSDRRQIKVMSVP